MCVCVHTLMRACMHAYMYMCVCVCVCVCARVHVCVQSVVLFDAFSKAVIHVIVCMQQMSPISLIKMPLIV